MNLLGAADGELLGIEEIESSPRSHFAVHSPITSLSLRWKVVVGSTNVEGASSFSKAQGSSAPPDPAAFRNFTGPWD